MALPRLSLTTRIFLSSAGIVIAVMAATLFLTQRSAERAAARSIGRALNTSEQRVQELLSSERGVLAGRLQAYANNAVYRANIESVTDGDYSDYLQTAVEETDAAWVQYVDREGILRARSDRPGVAQDTLTGSKLVVDALNGEVGGGFGVTADNHLMELVSVPVEGAGRRSLGALVAAKLVTDSIAEAVGAQTESEVLMFAFDTSGAPQQAASTEDAREASAVLLAQAQRAIEADTAPVMQAAAGMDSTVYRTMDVTVAGERFVARRAMLNNAAGNPVGGFLTLRSLDRELAATGFADLRRTLLFSGAGGVALALLVGFATARRVVRPVTVLAEASRRAADGDYQAEIPAGGNDEIGTLSGAFRRLLADLKEKQALVDFMSAAAAPGGTRTQVLNSGSAATLKIPTGMENLPVLQPGQTFGNRYEIKSVLGVGGMGMVYKANDRELGEMLAIKTLKPEIIAADTNALERFKSEIKLARRIAHRNVVRTYDLGEIGGTYYISMEYVEGKSLKDLIRERGRLPASAVIPIAKQLCRALEVSHEEGVIHRDIKPQNMVVQADGVLKVMDFGIARLATRPKESGHTEAGMVVGTPEYMAPEQLMGDELDARADLYATGVVLYECLVGRVPITADTPITLIAKVLEEEPKAPNAVQPDVPPALSELVMWVLAKDREKRPRSAAELHARLDAIALS
jgi:HAMP domain-containing protein/predicted Ser/Thr protein kinase